MSGELAVILTARTGSERLPGKMLAPVAGRPLIAWVIERLQQLHETVILATTTLSEDDELAAIGQHLSIPVARGPVADVVGRMELARRQYAPQAEFIMRGLGDCPFLELSLVKRAKWSLEKHQREAFLWATEPFQFPVYGAREFPYSRSGWEKILRLSQSSSARREHPDLSFHEERQRFQLLFHEPPKNVYFRAYRLEVDWPEDLALVRAVAEGPGMLAPLEQIIVFLDAHPDIAQLNRERVERTGPSTYPYSLRRQWHKLMQGQPVLRWDNAWWNPPVAGASPVFCGSGACLLGFASKGVLYTREAAIEGQAMVKCPCGAGRFWHGKHKETA